MGGGKRYFMYKKDLVCNETRSFIFYVLFFVSRCLFFIAVVNDNRFFRFDFFRFHAFGKFFGAEIRRRFFRCLRFRFIVAFGYVYRCN